jgi:hypothetical protein
MKDQHLKIKGYRELSQEEIDLMNEIKDQGTQLEALIAKLYKDPRIDHRWTAIGQTDLQKGIMSLVRSVARPDSF